MAAPLDILILAAGKGTRMKSDLPKVLHRVMGETLLHHVIRAARALSPRRIGVIVGHRRELVAESLRDEKDCELVVQAEQLGTGHAIRCAAAKFAGKAKDVVVLSGDVPLVRGETLLGLLNRHRQEKAAISLLTAILDEPGSLGRVLRDGKGHVARIVEARDATAEERACREVNAGIYVFKGDVLFKGVRNLAKQPNGEYYLTDVVTGAIASRARVSPEVLSDPAEASGINTKKELAEAHESLRRRILDAHAERGVLIVDPPHTFIAPGAVIGPGTVIQPFSVIGEAVSIGARCRIGPFAHLRPGTCLADDAIVGNFVEVKNSSLGQRSSARHLAYLGDAEIGDDVNIGAGVITANFDGVQKNRTVVESGARIGSNAVLIAPVRVARKATVGAGAVVTAGKDVAEGSVVVGIPARELSVSRNVTKPSPGAKVATSSTRKSAGQSAARGRRKR